MDKNKWKERFQKIKEWLLFPGDLDDADLDDFSDSYEIGEGVSGETVVSGEAKSGTDKAEGTSASGEAQSGADKAGSTGEPGDLPGGTIRIVRSRIGEADGTPAREPEHSDRKDFAEERELTLEERLAQNRRRRRILQGVLAALVLCVALGFYIYNRTHTFDDYVISKSIENTMTSGTQYEAVGKYLYRYNSDGVSCVTRKNEVKWSITYSMQAPIVDVCGTTMVIAEQQGTQVYVVNEDGLLGNFTCLLPILKVRVSNQGVVAVVLQDDDVTWVRLYDAEGNSIANDKTTISDSGYPLDVDLSPNGEKMVVSYLGIDEGVMTSNVVFYDFGSDGDSDSDHEISRETFAGSTVPQVYFTDNSTAVAIADDGFAVFGGSSLAKTAEHDFDEEIMSCFYDEDMIGFLFSDTTGEYKYRMELYNYRGRQKKSVGVDTDFDEIRIQNGQILMTTSSSISVYTKSGILRFSSAYEKEVVDIFYNKEFRRYLVITQDSFDRIRIC